MKKIVLGAVLVLFVTIGIGVYYLLSNLDMLVKVAIETYGSEATQTAVRVELSERQRRHPLVFGWPVILRLIRDGVYR